MLQNEILQIAERIRGLREMLEISTAEMAEVTGMTEAAYTACEQGEDDLSFTFLYNCAKRFGVDMTELITGDVPKLSFYTIVKKGSGMPIERRQGFAYQHLAYLFKNRSCEPFLVRAKYRQEEQDAPIALSRHKGQEFDYVLRGKLKVRMEEHTAVLEAGDAIYYDSGHGHGMIATGGEDCEFLALVLEEIHKKDREERA